MKKLLLIVILLVATVSLAGCALDVPADNSSSGSYANDAAKVEATQKRVQQSVPIPEIKTSAERKNIAERAKLFDNENKISYIYLVNYGKVMAFFTVKGKISSLNSYLTPEDKLVFADGSTCDRNMHSYGSYTWEPCYAVSAPDIDGAYGDNSNGIFFFTTEGAYVEWKGDYMMSDQPLKLTQQPELIREIK